MAGLTKEQIFKAAEQLIEQGKAPTLAEVRKLLGNGSFSTISEAMKEWREQQNQPTTPIREAAPQAVAERLEELGAEIWSIALGFANDRLKAEREALEAARIEMEQQQRETAEMADQLASEIEQLREQNNDLSFGLDTAKRSEQATTELWQEAKNENIKLHTELEGANKRIVDLQEEIAANRATIEADRKDREHIIGRERALAVEVQRLNDELNSNNKLHTASHQHLTEELQQAREVAKTAEETAKQAQIEAAQMKGELQALQKLIEQQNQLIKAAVAPKPNNAKPKKQPENEQNEQKG